MKRVLFITNYPSPYRVCFYDELAKYMDVTVLFSDRIEDKKHRSADWFISGEGRYKAVQLKKRVASMDGRDLCLDVTHWLKQKWDAIVVCFPLLIQALAWLTSSRFSHSLGPEVSRIRPPSTSI